MKDRRDDGWRLWVIAVAGIACGGRSVEFTSIPDGRGGASGGGSGGASSTDVSSTGSGGSTTSGGGGSGGSGDPPCFGWCPPNCNHDKTAFASARIWQITDQQYVNIVRDVLGVTLAGA